MQTQEPSIKQFKHKAEKRYLIIGYTLTIITVLMCGLVVYWGAELNGWTYLVLAGLLAPFIGNYVAKLLYYRHIADAIHIDENQMPELYKVYKEVALKMGFTEEKGKQQIPPLYVVNGYGVKSFFSSQSVFYQKYIVIKSDIAELIYEENPNIGALRFMFAHYLADVKCNHSDTKKFTIYPIIRLLFLHKNLSRAEQYTADRMACYYFSDDIDAVIDLHLTANFGEKINKEAYFEDIKKYQNNFFLKLANSSKDGLAYQRIKTLKEAQIKGWNVHGKIS
ncbi:MAG: hypothetical protein KGV59_04185 [Tenacibaculum sp.]|nr:hypothetical protein [Tenacibaculum sp.]